MGANIRQNYEEEEEIKEEEENCYFMFHLSYTHVAKMYFQIPPKEKYIMYVIG